MQICLRVYLSLEIQLTLVQALEMHQGVTRAFVVAESVL